MKKKRPYYRDCYYFVRDDGVKSCVWYEEEEDKKRFDVGNCFQTYEEAEAAAEKIKALLLSLHEEPSLPELTTEVFNKEDCPEWANYAAVDYSGEACYFESTPFLDDTSWCTTLNGNFKLIRDVGGNCMIFDSSDWKNSLIERPIKVQLPEWCKVDAIGWHKRCGYFKVTYIDDVSKRVDIQQVEDNSKGYLSFHSICKDTTQAHPRPYNAYEMKALVGKVIDTPDGCLFVDAYSKRDSDIHTAYGWFTADYLMFANYTIDGKPCSVFEHLNEKGEWIE